MKKIGIALGGGGARGLTHIGILKTLESNKVPISYISGTSMGAIVGAFYAFKPNAELLEERLKHIIGNSMFSSLKVDIFKKERIESKDSLFQKAQYVIKSGYLHLVGETQTALIGLEKLEELINMLLPDIDIKDTKIPFSCVACDLTNGIEKIFDSGPIRRAVVASSAIPGVFPPVEINGIYYNDGGAVSVTPVNAVKQLGADYVIACDVKSRVTRMTKLEKAKDIISRSNYVTGSLLSLIQLRSADVVISPAVKHLHWSDFNKIDFIIKKGERAALLKLWIIKTKPKFTKTLDNIITYIKKALHI